MLIFQNAYFYCTFQTLSVVKIKRLLLFVSFEDIVDKTLCHHLHLLSFSRILCLLSISVICTVIRKIFLFEFDCLAVVTCRKEHLSHFNSMPFFIVLLIFAVCAVSEKNDSGSVARSKNHVYRSHTLASRCVWTKCLVFSYLCLRLLFCLTPRLEGGGGVQLQFLVK